MDNSTIGLSTQRMVPSLTSSLVRTTAQTRDRFFSPNSRGKLKNSCVARQSPSFSIQASFAGKDNGTRTLSSKQFAAIDRRDRQLRVELDNGTERVRSPKNTDSRQRKIRLYDQYQGGYRTRFRAFLVTTRSQQRLGYILDNAAELVRNP